MEKEQRTTQQQKSFRVIVVGGGLVAITAAHILSKADIDFVILERCDDLMPKIGSLVALWPATYRIFNQLGILDVFLPMLNDFEDIYTIDANDGSLVRVLKGFSNIWTRNFGYGFGYISRTQFLNTLYGCLPESAKNQIRVKKHVTAIETLPDGVRVQCEDGTVEEGAIVIGADGVHSRTRQCMEALASGKPKEQVSQDTESPCPVTYRAIIGDMTEIYGFKGFDIYQASGYGVASQTWRLRDGSAWWYLFEALEEPAQRRQWHTAQDKQEMMNKYADLHAAPGYRFRDLFSLSAGNISLINLEEGKVDRWTWGGRIALVGDAVRKLHPNSGLGYNRGVGDVVELLNGLRWLVQSHEGSGEGQSLTGDMLQVVLDEYEKGRKESETIVREASRMNARGLAWPSWGYRFVARWIDPFLPLAKWLTDYVLAPVVAREPAIDWLEETELPQGTSPWLRHPRPQRANEH
ncbi:putative monooxygenase [Nemania abortiva]|nr:putative monooxygenase [Nemania abortiva]